jgi:four helix bundle protein
MKNYKHLIVWQKAHALVVHLYKHTIGFPKHEEYNLKSQIRRAATSIPTNIAEGCGKFTQSDLANFMQIALGSANEVEYLALLSYELGYLNNDTYQDLDGRVNEVKAMLISLVRKIRKDSKPT